MHPLRSTQYLPDLSSKTAYTAYPSLHGSSQRSHLHGTSHPLSAACQLRSTSTHLRSEEHTSELQSRGHLVCRLLLEKKKKKNTRNTISKRTHSAKEQSRRHIHT